MITAPESQTLVQRKASLRKYAQQHFVIDHATGERSPLCTPAHFGRILESQESPLVESESLLGCKLEVLHPGERKIASKEFLALWRELPSKVAGEATALAHQRFIDIPLPLRIVEYACKDTAAATVLAQEKLLEWRAHRSAEKLTEASELLFFAASQGDPSASFLLATTTLDIEHPTNEDEDKEYAHGRYIKNPIYLCDEDQRTDFLKWACRCGYMPAIEFQREQGLQSDIAEENSHAAAEMADIDRLDELKEEIGNVSKAANQGNAEAQWRLGNALFERAMIEFRRGFEEDSTKRMNEAWKWIEKAAEGGSSDALLRLSSRSDISSDSKFSLLKMAAFPEKGPTNPKALCDLATEYERRGDFANAESCLRAAASYKESGAEFRLAVFLLAHFVGETERLTEARNLLASATKAFGYARPASALRLGLMLLRGEGGERNVEQASHYIELALDGRFAKHDVTHFTAKLVSILAWGKNNPGATAAEHILRWLAFRDFSPEPEFLLQQNDIKVLQSLNPAFNEVPFAIELITEHGIDTDRVTPLNCFGWLTSYTPILQALLYILRTPTCEAGYLNGLLSSSQSMVENFLRGKLWMSGRLGSKDSSKAMEHFNAVAELGKQIESKLLLGPESIRANDFLEWLREKTVTAQLDVKNVLLELKSEDLARTNRDLEDRTEELANLMGMFAHKFRGPVARILYNVEHGHEQKIYVDVAKRLKGLLKVFKYVSASSSRLTALLMNDCKGEETPLDVFKNSLFQTLIDFFAPESRDRMSRHYWRHAIRAETIPANLPFPVWYSESEWQPFANAIRSKCEAAVGKMLGDSDLAELQVWLEDNLFPVSISGLQEARSRFARYGDKSNVLAIVMDELLSNAIKHYDCQTGTPFVFSWKEDGQKIQISVSNPSSDASRTFAQGSGRGLKFIRQMVVSVGGTIEVNVLSDPSTINVSFPRRLFFSEG